MVLGDLFRWQMAVVVEYGHVASVLMIQLDGLVILQEEVFGKECVAQVRSFR